MKKILTLCALSLVATAAFAVPAKPGQWKTIRLADGTELRAELKGDEWGSYWLAENGKAYNEETDKGFFVQVDAAAINANAQMMRAEMNSQRSATLKKTAANAKKGQVFTGQKKGLIILANFKNTTIRFNREHTKEFFDKVANTENYSDPELGYTGSIRDYFKAQSLGKLDVEFDVVGPVDLPRKTEYYGLDSGSGVAVQRDIHAGEFAADAIKAADEYVNFADYDWDGDGTVEQVFILYAGKGQHDGGGSYTIWPHQSKLSASDYKSALKLDGVTIDTYACSSELQGTGSVCGIGTICHEFSHCLGYPDIYDGASGNWGMGTWDIMDMGSYIDDGFTPACYTGLERMLAGWQNATVLRNDTTVTAMQPISEGGEFFIVYNEGYKNEFYILENHQNVGWDKKRTGTGLLVTYADYSESVWKSMAPNSGSSYSRCTVITADGVKSDNYPENNAFPYGSVNSLTDTSSPAATLNHANINGTKLMGKPITNIRQNADGTVSFDFKRNVELSSQPDPWEDVATGIRTVESLDSKASSRIYTIDGRLAGTDAASLKSGIYVVNGKKFVK